MKKLFGISSIILSIFTVSSCDIFSYELSLDYEMRMAYSLYSASSMLTTSNYTEYDEASYQEKIEFIEVDPTENYIIEQVEYYYTMFEKYIGKSYDDFAAVATDVDLIDGYNHSINFMINTINYHVVYNEFNTEVTDEVGNMDGLMYIGTGEDQIILNIEGALYTSDNPDNIYIKAVSGSDYVKIKLDDGMRGASYSYTSKLDGIMSSTKVRTMSYSNKPGFEVTDVVDGEKNKFKFMEVTSDDKKEQHVTYDVNGEKGSITISIDTDDTIVYDIIEGKRKGHQYISEDKRNKVFKN